MKKILSVICVMSLLVFSIAATAQTKSATSVKAKSSFFGVKITESNAIEATTLLKQMEGKDSLNIKVRGKVKEVCQRKGCWMNVDLGNGKEMKVRFKDYGFFVPKNINGKTVVMEGIAYKTETPVEELRHYAEDAGKSKTEIEKINQAEKNTSFEASGVIVFNE